MKNVLIMLVCFQMSAAARAQVIPYFEGKLDCDTAYTNIEMGLCSRYFLDSAAAEMNALVTRLAQRIDSASVETTNDLSATTDPILFDYLRDDTARLRTMRRELFASQEAFMAYSSHSRDVVGEMIGMGRERAIQENYEELDLVIGRIEVLKRWLEFY